MDQILVSTTIAKPREEIFSYLADIANHPEFTDHYLLDWHLTRVESVGVGAGARYKIKTPFSRFSWADATIAEIHSPYRIVEHGRGGKFNRMRMLTTYTLSPGAAGTTKVELSFESEAKLISDKLLDAVGRRPMKRHMAKSMRRLRTILEEDRGRGKRVAVAAR